MEIDSVFPRCPVLAHILLVNFIKIAVPFDPALGLASQKLLLEKLSFGLVVLIRISERMVLAQQHAIVMILGERIGHGRQSSRLKILLLLLSRGRLMHIDAARCHDLGFSQRWSLDALEVDCEHDVLVFEPADDLDERVLAARENLPITLIQIEHRLQVHYTIE